MWSGHQKENKKTGYIVKVVFFNYCAKHYQHAWHANTRGSGGVPPRKILKNRCSETEFWGYFRLNVCII